MVTAALGEMIYTLSWRIVNEKVSGGPTYCMEYKVVFDQTRIS